MEDEAIGQMVVYYQQDQRPVAGVHELESLVCGLPISTWSSTVERGCWTREAFDLI